MDTLTALDAKMMKMYLRDFARINNDKKFSDGYGNYVSAQIPTYTWGSHPYPWDVPFGTEILIYPDCLTGYGANTQGIKMRSNLVNWQPADRGQLLYGASSSIASPLVTGVAGSASDVSLLGGLAQPMIPAYMLYKGCRGIVKCQIRKTNANSTFELVVRLGNTPAPNITTNQALFDFASITNADKRDFWVEVEFVITDAGPFGVASMKVTNWLTKNGSGTNVATDRGSTTTTVAPMYLNINIKAADASDTFALTDYSLELLPQ